MRFGLLLRSARRVRTRRGILLPLTIALVLRVVLALAMPAAPAWDGVIYERAATSIALGRGFTRAALHPSQPEVPTAFFPVGFPATLAVFRGLGGGRLSDHVLQISLSVLIVPLVALLARRLRGARAGRAAAFWVALWPGGVLLSLSWMSEPLFVFLVTLALVPISFSRRAKRSRGFAISALILALAAYVRPVAIPILSILALFTALREPRRVRALIRNFLLCAVAVTIVHLPWMIRNANSLGAPAFVSSNGGNNLLLGTLGEGHFDSIPEEVDCPRELGEIAKDRCRTARALERIRAAPLDAIARGMLKLTHTFGHESGPAYGWASSLPSSVRPTAELWALAISRVFWLALLAAAAIGLSRCGAATRGVTFVAVLAPVLGIAVLHAVVLGGDRYHAPAAPIFCMFAGLAIEAAARKATHSVVHQRRPAA